MKCHYCGTTTDLRPYGPHGSMVCFDCAMSTPEREKETAQNFAVQLDAIKGPALLDMAIPLTHPAMHFVRQRQSNGHAGGSHVISLCTSCVPTKKMGCSMTAPTSEQVIEWAQGAGFTVRNGVIKAVHSNGSWVELSERLAEFAALAFAAGQDAQGGAAFPQPCTAKGSAANSPFGIADDCMTVRDYLAAHAPVELGTVLKVYGDENADLFLDNVRASYMAILAMVRYEYADAMLTEREKER